MHVAASLPKSVLPLALLLAFFLLSPPALLAQQAEDDGPTEEELGFDPNEIDEILIQGQRSDASSQATAIAVSSFNQTSLDQLGVANVSGLQQNVPSLQIGRSGNQAIITIRGVGIENLTAVGQPGVIFEQDGVPLLRPSGALAAFYDVAALDVARGPQGTGGGYHATGGTIAVTSVPPTPDLSAQGDVQLGTYDQYVFRGVVNAPLYQDKVMMRVTTRFEERDGFQRALGPKLLGLGGAFNLPVQGEFRRSEDFDDAHDLLLRGQLRFQLTDTLDVRTIGQYAFLDNNGPGIHLLSPPGLFSQLGNPVCKRGPEGSGALGTAGRDPVTSFDPRVSFRDEPGKLDQRIGFTTIQVNKDWETESFGDLKGVVQFGFNRIDQTAVFDFDGTDACANVIDNSSVADQYTGEVSLATVDQRPWEWKVGIFYLREVQNNDQFIDFFVTHTSSPDKFALSRLDT